jgi:hypothetical protein
MVRHHWFIGFLLGLVMSETAWAARLLYATVELDGRIAFRSAYQDDDWNGVAPAARVWTYLGREPLWSEATNNVGSDLRGVVAIRIMHADRLIAQASVTNLTLKSSKGKWFLPTDEMQRTARVAGLAFNPVLAGDPGRLRSEQKDIWLWVASIAVLAGGSLAVWFWLAGRKAQRQSNNDNEPA